MAWTNITNAQLAIGAPLRSIDILALRDNVIYANSIRGQVFTSNGTFVVPENVEAIKVTVVGGGGGSSGGSSFGGTGGTTTFTGYVSATGGGGGTYGALSNAGGTATSANMTLTGRRGYGLFAGDAIGWGAGGESDAPSTGYGAGGTGPSSLNGGAGAGVGVRYITGLITGSTISVTIGGGGSAGSAGGVVGLAGICVVEW